MKAIKSAAPQLPVLPKTPGYPFNPVVLTVRKVGSSEAAIKPNEAVYRGLIFGLEY